MKALKQCCIGVLSYIGHDFERFVFVIYNCTLYMHKCACTTCCTASVQHQVEKQLAALFVFFVYREKKMDKGKTSV